MALAQDGAGALVERAKIFPRACALEMLRILHIDAANIGALLIDAAKLRGAVKMAAGAIFCCQMRRER